MAIFLNNQGVRTPPERGIGRCVHTFRRGLFVKFRKSPHRTKKALRHAQKPATPRSTNPIGPESTYVVPGEDPPMANPPQGPKNDVGEALSGHSRPLLRLAKVTQKRGFSRRFCRRFSSGFPPVFQRFCRQFSGSFPAVCRWFDGFPGVRRRRGAPGSTPVRLRRTPSSERNCRAIPYTLSSLQTQHMGRGKFPPVHGVPGRSAAGRNPTPLVEVLGDRIAVQDASGGISLGTSPTGHSGQRDADFA